MNDETDEPAIPRLTAAGGWCAPSSVLAAMAELSDLAGPPDERFALPKVTVNKGGITFPRPPGVGDPGWEAYEAARRAHEALNALVWRLIGDLHDAQDRDIDLALRDALRDGYEVHIHPAPWGVDIRPEPMGPTLRGPYRFIGIELTEKTRRHTAVHWHTASDHTYDDPADWDEDY
jgi:hypothetical protein